MIVAWIGVRGGEGQVPSGSRWRAIRTGCWSVMGVVGGEGQVPSAAGGEPSGHVIDVGRLVVEMLLVGKQLTARFPRVSHQDKLLMLVKYQVAGVGGEVLVRQLPQEHQVENHQDM